MNWERYRKRYPRMSYGDVAAFHRELYREYPVQVQHSPETLAAFLERINRPSIVEVGGWRGEAAAAMLPLFPGIVRWDNYEICAPAAKAKVTSDPRYRGIFPPRWVWELTPEPHDTAVLSHVLEHLRSVQVGLLVGWLRACGVVHVYVELPLDAARSWTDYEGSHVLEVGLPEVVDIFATHGYALRERGWHAPESHVLSFADATVAVAA